MRQLYLLGRYNYEVLKEHELYKGITPLNLTVFHDIYATSTNFYRTIQSAESQLLGLQYAIMQDNKNYKKKFTL